MVLLNPLLWRRMKVLIPFWRILIEKWTLIALLEFELANYNVTIQHVCDCSTGTFSYPSRWMYVYVHVSIYAVCLKVLRLKLHLPKEKWTMNENLISFEIGPWYLRYLFHFFIDWNFSFDIVQSSTMIFLLPHEINFHFRKQEKVAWI